MPDKNKIIANWIYCNGSAITDQTTAQSKDTIILYYYSIFSCYKWGGRGLHFRTSSRNSGKAYLFNPQTPCKISISETFHLKLTPKHHFDIEFDKTPILRHFTNSHHTKNHHYSTQKSNQTIEK